MKKFSFSRLLLIFTVIPFIELFLLLELAQATSALTTFAIIITTGVIGAYLTKYEGLDVISKIKNAFNMGQLPTNQMIHGLCLIIGGAFLITPGILTDIVGFTLVVPYTRTFYVNVLKEWAMKNINVQQSYYRDYD